MSNAADIESDVAIELRDVCASFRRYGDRATTIRERLVGRKSDFEEHFALKGVSFAVQSGETFGIIGTNGSGKSTTLKIIARIFEPNSGSIVVRGRVAPMLELGAGFHGELSGRENVYLNASVLGYPAEFVDEIYDEIVAFAELEKFMSQPVRTYSSGMYLRLGFSVAIHLEPDVLLVDEVLAVGDERFKRRCLERIDLLRRNGSTIVVVSHDLGTVERLCDRVLFMERGEVRTIGPSAQVVAEYRKATGAASRHRGWDGGAVRESGTLSIEGFDLRDKSGREVVGVSFDDELVLSVTARAHANVSEPVFGMIIRDASGVQVYATNTLWLGQQTGHFSAGEEVSARFAFKAGLFPGRYRVTIATARADGSEIYSWKTDAVEFRVNGKTSEEGYVPLGASISVASTAEPAEDLKATSASTAGRPVRYRRTNVARTAETDTRAG